MFNCNTNMQIGDISQVYYSTLYGSKSTQKDDSERVQQILAQSGPLQVCLSVRVTYMWWMPSKQGIISVTLTDVSQLWWSLFWFLLLKDTLITDFIIQE